MLSGYQLRRAGVGRSGGSECGACRASFAPSNYGSKVWLNPSNADPCARKALARPSALAAVFKAHQAKPLEVRKRLHVAMEAAASSDGEADLKVNRTIGFIGAGQMAEALSRGFIASGRVDASNITASNPSKGRLKVFSEMGARTTSDNAQVVASSDILFLAVKPWYIQKVVKDISSRLEDRHILVSIAAGVTLDQLQEAAGGSARVIRVMPNTPCWVGAAASALCLGGGASDEDAGVVEDLLGAVGRSFRVEEGMINAVSGLSGSGPAYVFLMIEALADGGVRAGLPRSLAQALAAQTVLGAAKMVLESGQQPGALKDSVASPAGTTIAGLHELEKGALRGTVMNAVLASKTRADELSK